VPVEIVVASLGNTPRMVQQVHALVIAADDAGAAPLVGRAPTSGRSIT
jgi:hypothetical protein